MKVYTLIQQNDTPIRKERTKFGGILTLEFFFLNATYSSCKLQTIKCFCLYSFFLMLTQFFSQVTVYYIDHRGKKLAQCKWFLVRFFSLFFELALITFIWIFLVLEFESNSLIRQNILNNIFVTIV